MAEALNQGGIIMYPLLVVGAGVLLLAGRATWLLARRDGSAAEAQRMLHGVIFWGAFSVMLGLLGTTIGIIQMSQAIVLLGGVEPPLVWAGLGVSLVTLIFGLLIFLLAALLWFPLREWAGRQLARERTGVPAV